MKLFDLSPPIDDALQVWDNDTPPRREILASLAKGDSVNLSTLRTTVHLGSHADGFNHYGEGQPGVGELPLHHFLGPCHVLDAPATPGARLRPDQVRHLDAVRHPRVLLKTGTFPDFTRWHKDFSGLTVQLIDALAARGVVTIGTDCPSVDDMTSKDLPAHKAILRHRIAILEGLVLAPVPPGDYELIALPLKLIGYDGSPVRAVLRPL